MAVILKDKGKGKDKDFSSQSLLSPMNEGKKMGLFSKKTKCDHKFRDFSWYPVYREYGGYSHYLELYEPYVCVKCGYREDKLLDKILLGHSVSSSQDTYDKIIKKFGSKIKPRAIVEDEINDAVMVDKAFLKVWDDMNGLSDSDYGKIYEGYQKIKELTLNGGE